MDYLRTLHANFWHESSWFPPGVNWTHMAEPVYPIFSDLYRPFFYAFIVLGIRTAFEWSIARPLGIAFGIKDTRSELPNFFHRLQDIFRKIIGKREEHVVESTMEANGHVANGDLTTAKIAHSGRSRSKSATMRIHLVPVKSTLDKFAECCWRFTYYVGIFIYGLVVLWNKSWFSDTLYFWYGYPFHPISSEIWLYYMIELSFYWSLIFSQFVDVQRKDFWVNFIHHIATVLLMSFSWANNFVRIGTAVLLVHDAVDFWLEGAKMSRYCKRNSLCNGLFVVFAAVWFLTRCLIYPFWIIYSAIVEAPALILFYRAYYIFNFLLFLLLILHIFWSIMILNIAINALRSGEADDARSDSEDDVTDDNNGKAKANGKAKQ